MTLGNASAARVRLIVWCRDWGHQTEPDAAEVAARYGAEARPAGVRPSGSRRVDLVVTGGRR
jgi:hypothetical protein